jgi:hypothetical protein
LKWSRFAAGPIFSIDANQIGVLDGRMTRRQSSWEKAEKFGVDMALLKANLDKTPTRRVRDHLSALALADRLRQAGGKRHARIRKAS